VANPEFKAYHEVIMYRVLARLLLALSAATIDASYGEAISLKSQNGVLVVPVVINDKITLDFTVDSGASDVSIPLDVFSTLQRTDTISLADLLPPGIYTLADGSAHKQIRFRIRSLRVGSLELHNVIGSVAPIQGSLLLGQSFLSRFRRWSVDNQHHVLLIDETPIPPEVAQSASVAPAETFAAGVSPERYAAARARCREKAVPSDYSLCDTLTAEDVIRSEAVAVGAQPSANAFAAGVSPERYAAARARCREKAVPSDYSLCDTLTAEDVTRSEAAAAGAQAR
jgi:predicted aspartyl protease